MTAFTDAEESALILAGAGALWLWPDGRVRCLTDVPGARWDDLDPHILDRALEAGMVGKERGRGAVQFYLRGEVHELLRRIVDQRAKPANRYNLP